MAESPSHRFGQVVGKLLEELIEPELLDFCKQPGLFLDRHGARKNVRSGKKVSWQDRYENSHDLDFVIEKNGSENERGRPVAFIEAAWRRYSKHSRAKAQEIQGAVLPIAEKYELEAPFLGVILAGVFTKPSLDQLRSLGFNIVHLSYETIVAAFAEVEIDARFDEKTPDTTFRHCVNAIEALKVADRQRIKTFIKQSNSAQFTGFFDKLRHKLDRLVARVTILPLFGTPTTFGSATQALDFLSNFDPKVATGAFHKYDVAVTFTNGDEIRGTFADREKAEHFLRYVTS